MEKKEVWILFSVANDYNQPDAAFEKIFFKEPTFEDLKEYEGMDYWVEKFTPEHTISKESRNYKEPSQKSYKFIEFPTKESIWGEGLYALRTDNSITTKAKDKTDAVKIFREAGLLSSGQGKKTIICLQERTKKD
jgi:hypothetical protein